MIVVVIVALAAVATGTVWLIKGHQPEQQPAAASSPTPVTFGDGDYQFRTGGDGAPKVRNCDPQTVVNNRKCGDVKIVVINAQKMPYVAGNIFSAWLEGKPAVLHKESDVGNRKYNQTCGGNLFTAVHPNGSCDEYPFKSSLEGGVGARTKEVPRSEQNCQGGTINRAYTLPPVINEGDEFVVVISHPDSIHTEAWDGQPATVTDDTCLIN